MFPFVRQIHHLIFVEQILKLFTEIVIILSPAWTCGITSLTHSASARARKRQSLQVRHHRQYASRLDSGLLLPKMLPTTVTRAVVSSFSRHQKRWFKNKNDGAQGRDRTTDTRIFSPLLYQLSYLGLFRQFGEARPRLQFAGPLRDARIETPASRRWLIGNRPAPVEWGRAARPLLGRCFAIERHRAHLAGEVGDRGHLNQSHIGGETILSCVASAGTGTPGNIWAKVATGMIMVEQSTAAWSTVVMRACATAWPNSLTIGRLRALTSCSVKSGMVRARLMLEICSKPAEASTKSIRGNP